MLRSLCLTTLVTTSALLGCATTQHTPEARTAPTNVIIDYHWRAVAFRVLPYVQNPTQTEISILWLSEKNEPGSVAVYHGSQQVSEFHSTPRPATDLAYHPADLEQMSADQPRHTPFLHRVRLTDLQPQRRYHYVVYQSDRSATGSFRTAPRDDTSVRFTVFADSETEPESTGSARRWAAPFGDRDRRYVADQTVGFRENLRVIASRMPDFIAIPGDLVESGGEQRDWDEFWRHVAGEFNHIASRIPIFPALGNHDLYPGPDEFGRWNVPDVRRALAKYTTYFELPDDPQAGEWREHYYRIDYGPITLITLDSTNGSPNASGTDSNSHIPSGRETLPDGTTGIGPDFNPGTRQYEWLEAQLADAQRRSQFTFVQFHHTPYSVGPHDLPPGDAGFRNGEDPHSSLPLRVLTPLFLRYGVDAIFCGHDEMYERSAVPGTETRPDGTTRDHTLLVYDIGIGGDGLRGPYVGKDGVIKPNRTNPYQQFLAHLDAPEVWDGKRLVSGGKHYGHLEVNVTRTADGTWKCTLEPVHIFPIMNAAGEVTDWERRLYDDVVTITN